MLALWIFIFVVSLAALVKGADWMLESAERIGLAVGLSPFIVGVTIVGLGTSFPEVISSIFAILAGANEIVAANAIGSNIANILLVVGISAIVGRNLVVTKNLIDLDLPLIAATTALFAGVAFDGVITQLESLILFATFTIYFVYTLTHEAEDASTGTDTSGVIPNRNERRHLLDPRKITDIIRKNNRPEISWLDGVLLVVGVASLAFGAKYLIDSVIKLSEIIGIGTGPIALFAVAVGTSLPELLVSVKAAWQKKSEVALGNIFGSNVFNLLFVVGAPGLFVTLTLDDPTRFLALPVLIVATFLFIISGISRRIHSWEGAMYLVIYIFFCGKLFGLI